MLLRVHLQNALTLSWCCKHPAQVLRLRLFIREANELTPLRMTNTTKVSEPRLLSEPFSSANLSRVTALPSPMAETVVAAVYH